MAGDDTRRYSPDELEDEVGGGDYVPTRKDAPEIELDEDFWRKARVVMPPRKKSVDLRVDATCWTGSGPGARLSDPTAFLRSYMEAHRHDRRSLVPP